MSCFYPITGYRKDTGEVSFRETGNVLHPITIACGRCTGCRVARSKAWAIRCMHEAQMHKQNCFITLTYNDEHYQPGLFHEHFQKFIRAVRKKTKKKILYFMCGEYGSEFGRPHYHALIFGHDFKNKSPLRTIGNGKFLYRSTELESYWTKGFSSVGEVTLDSASYIARYTTKKLSNQNEDPYWSCNPYTGELTAIPPEYLRMSLKPAIGKLWFDRYKSDVYPTGELIVNGKKFKPPTYYERMFKEQNPLDYEELSHARQQKVNFDDQTKQRLAEREHVLKAKLKLKTRKL